MSSEKKLHIICFDVPYPPNYGGVIDLFYKIKALHAEGVKIKLHCFSYGRQPQEELKKYCDEVYYYQRKTGINSFSFSTPYIVRSRSNDSLDENLLKDKAPILIEGIHCSAILRDPRFKDRKTVLRLHNVESSYYHQLYKSERNLFKKCYYFFEGKTLRSYERNLNVDLPVLAMTEKDVSYYKSKFGKKDTRYLPAFTPFRLVAGEEGMGDYCLYHGNLSIPENEKAVIWLISKVFSKTKKPLMIAGRCPSPRLQKLATKLSHVSVVADPSDTELDELVKRAHIHVLPSFNVTGVKLKLINALFNGRHCVVNPAAIEGTGFEAACHSGENPDAIASIIEQLYHLPFSEEEIALRKKILPVIFDNANNAKRIIQWLW